MRWTAVIFAAALGLTACGQDSGTPLTHAIAALRAGDRDDFLKAKAEADDLVKSSWQEGDDPCKLTIVVISQRGEAALVAKLDHADLFKLSEPARFVYVAKVVGKLNAAMMEMSDSGLMHQLYYGNSSFSNPIPATTCSPLAAAAGTDPLAEGPPGEMERRAALKDWLDTLIDRAGNASAFGDSMHVAVAELDKNGFSAEWPEQIEFVEDPNIPTFGQVQAEIAGKAGH